MPSASKRPRMEEEQGNNRTVQLDEEDVTCPVCLDYMMGSIMQCGEGHAVCENCASALPLPRRCHTCRQPYPGGNPVRNRILEGLVSKATFPCKDGCGYSGKPPDLIQHAIVCLQRKIVCPYQKCLEELTIGDLPAHFDDKHPKCVGKAVAFHGRLDRIFSRNQCGFGPYVSREHGTVSKVNFWSDLSMTSHTRDAMILEFRAFHIAKRQSVRFSVRYGDEVLAQGPWADSEQLGKGETAVQVRKGCLDCPHLFLKKQLDNCAKDGISFHLEVREPVK